MCCKNVSSYFYGFCDHIFYNTAVCHAHTIDFYYVVADLKDFGRHFANFADQNSICHILHNQGNSHGTDRHILKQIQCSYIENERVILPGNRVRRESFQRNAACNVGL